MKIVKIIIVIIIILAGLLILGRGQFNKTNTSGENLSPTPQSNSSRIVSTKPDPLDNTIIPTDQIIEITFSKPLQAASEFKNRMDPQISYKIELSPDKKTAKIIPAKPYELGATYTLFIESYTKFEDNSTLGQTRILHFKTITYKGV